MLSAVAARKQAAPRPIGRLCSNVRNGIVTARAKRGSSRDALAAAAGAGGVVSGDFSTIAGARTVADEVNQLGRFDAVIHNAGIGYRERRVELEPGVPSVFAVNVLAPYILTALIERPKRLVYLSSGMHRGVRHHREVVPEHRESGQAVRPLVNWRMEDVWLDEYLPRKYKWPNGLMPFRGQPCLSTAHSRSKSLWRERRPERSVAVQP